MKSIRRELLRWLLVGLAVAIVVAGAGTYYQAREEANELFDYQIRQMAFSIPQGGAIALPEPDGDSDVEEDFVVEIWDTDGRLAYASSARAAVPRQASSGFVDVAAGDRRWRVFVLPLHGRQIQVAQPLSLREELAAGMAFRTVAPLLVVLPLLGVLTLLTVRRGLRPLLDVTRAVHARSPVALPPLDETGLPDEVRPLVHALNDLLGRLERAMAAQKTFIADAAHELRTPLTAIQLQLDEARSVRDAGEREAAFDDLQRGLTRAVHLVGQLLTLARQDPEVADRPLKSVDLSDIARAVVAEQAPAAAAKQVDLGVGEAEPLLVQGDAEALRVMLGNLVDNAIRHSPPGGAVDVVVARREHRAVLSVEDAGPGIPVTDRERVFERFARGSTTRGSGSGLGLAIVKSIADRHRAVVELSSREGGDGLRVSVTFPA